jgi:hypothetical protein
VHIVHSQTQTWEANHAEPALRTCRARRTEELRALTWDLVDLDGNPDASPPVPPHLAVWTAQAAAQTAAAPEASSDDRMDKVKELGEMKSQGLLTEGEFAAEKARTLGT